MQPEFPVIESMTTVHLGAADDSGNAIDPGPYKIRVWRTESELHDSYDNPDIIERCNDYFRRVIRSGGWDTFKPRELIRLLSTLVRVSAIEIVDRYGNGSVVYVEWP